MFGRSITFRLDEYAWHLIVEALEHDGERRKKLQLVARDIMDRDGWARLRIERRIVGFSASTIRAGLRTLPSDHGAMASQLRLNVLRNRNGIPRSKANEERWAEMVAAWKRQA